jgi:hypothetical protein
LIFNPQKRPFSVNFSPFFFKFSPNFSVFNARTPFFRLKKRRISFPTARKSLFSRRIRPKMAFFSVFSA